MPKTTSEKIQALQTEVEQKQNLIKQLIQQEKEEQRKARTHRLIERGAILESLIENAETLTDEQIKTLLEKTVGSSYGTKILAELKGQNSVVSAQRAEVTQEEDS